MSVDEILKFDHSNESYLAERCTLELLLKFEKFSQDAALSTNVKVTKRTT